MKLILKMFWIVFFGFFNIFFGMLDRDVFLFYYLEEHFCFFKSFMLRKFLKHPGRNDKIIFTRNCFTKQVSSRITNIPTKNIPSIFNSVNDDVCVNVEFSHFVHFLLLKKIKGVFFIFSRNIIFYRFHRYIFFITCTTHLKFNIIS